MMPALDAGGSRSTSLLIGGAVLVLSVGLFIGLLVVVGRGRPEARAVPNALLYVDVPGRITVNGKTVALGPAPIPVTAGSHRLVFLDRRAGSANEVSVSVAAGEFRFVPDPAAGALLGPYLASGGQVTASVFPPDGTIEIPNCTPREARSPRVCRQEHAVSAELNPGTYTIRYQHPRYPAHEEQVTVPAGVPTQRSHSFLRTVAEWEEWKNVSGRVLERYGARAGYRGGESFFAAPFEALGEVTQELFGLRPE